VILRKYFYVCWSQGSSRMFHCNQECDPIGISNKDFNHEFLCKIYDQKRAINAIVHCGELCITYCILDK